MRSTHHLIRPAHLNQFGFLFGGQLLAWVDEDCWISASLSLPGCRFVTIGMESVEFKHRVSEGDILRIDCLRKQVGNTSVTFEVQVYSNSTASGAPIFSTDVSFVNVDEQGNKAPIPAAAKQCGGSL